MGIFLCSTVVCFDYSSMTKIYFDFIYSILDILMSMSNTRNSDRNSTSSFHDNVRQIAEKKQQLEAKTREAIRRLPIVLNEQQIKRLKEHKYASEGITLLDPFMQEFWKWLVQFCPLWVAPNLITIVGLALNIGTSILLMILTNGATEQVHRFIFYLFLK